MALVLQIVLRSIGRLCRRSRFDYTLALISSLIWAKFGSQFVNDCAINVCNANCDSDGDGYGGQICGGADCDDGNAAINPGATEYCDEVDNDCDGQTDEGCPCPETCVPPVESG
jgi:hypothetical protein